MSKQEYQTKKINLQNCPVCSNPDTMSFFQAESVPVFCNVLWDSREKALSASLAGIHLAYCNKCGLIYNIAFDNKLTQYSEAYENSLHFSQQFRKWADRTADRLVRKYRLYDKDIIEIGCGQGDFLELLQQIGNNRVLGFDPSYNPDKKDIDKEKPKINIIPKTYSEDFDSYLADFICCRHVLEHIEKPLEFLKSIRKTIGNKKNCIVYFEVPNALFTIKHLGIWDIIYEHCSYFTLQSIANLFIQAGFEPIEIAEHYESQFLTIEARPAYEDSSLVANHRWMIHNMQQLINSFQNVYLQKTSSWQNTLAELENQNSRTVIWGAGSKGVTFTNTMNISYKQIEHLVDINPRKFGKFVPGTAQSVVGPDFLKKYCPQTIIIMNPIYQNEIRANVKKLGLTTNFLTG
ncbi:MAG: methyltransferase domain-containing protein [Sedimentisphaerales bacterium]|nr:methyltransferase domain-containing protein [Sedimentisphaerales bacterium]